MERKAFGGAYLSARYESLKEDGDFTVKRYLTGIVTLNPGEEELKAKSVDEAVTRQVTKDLEPRFEVLEKILALLEASKSLVFLSYWSFAKVHGPNITFVENLMKARGDLDRSGVSEVMESIKRKVKEDGLTDRAFPPHFGQNEWLLIFFSAVEPTIMKKIAIQGAFSRFLART